MDERLAEWYLPKKYHCISPDGSHACEECAPCRLRFGNPGDVALDRARDRDAAKREQVTIRKVSE